MIDLDQRFNDSSVRHDDAEIAAAHAELLTLRDITEKRIYVPNFPFSCIDYNPDDNYRKSNVNPDCDEIKDLGRGIQNSGLQQPIGLFAHELSATDLANLAVNAEALKLEDTWKSRISTIFGNRRYLAITHHTDMNNAGAYIYPREAIKYRRDIALIENMDSEGVRLHEEAVALYEQIVENHDGNVSSFARFSGKSPTDLNRLYKIGQAAKEHEAFYHILEDGKYKDIIALDNLARAILEDKSQVRKDKIDKLITMIKDFEGKISNFRKQTKAARAYSDGSTNKVPDIVPREREKEEEKPNNSHQTKQEETVSKEELADIKLIRKIQNLQKALCDAEPLSISQKVRECITDFKGKLEEQGF